MDEVIKILPIRIKNKIIELTHLENITEIRLRVGTNIIIYCKDLEKQIEVVVQKEDLLDILKNISSNSIYSLQKDLNKGYITIKGGHRIGVAGEVVVIDGKIKNIKEISSMNIRIAYELLGVASNIMPVIFKDNKIKNTLIVSPPCMGKTTLLRDIIRCLSNNGKNVCVIDERGEIAAMYNGISKLNLGPRTDVISFVDKSYGMQMAVRSLSPNVVCTDEIGDVKDFDAIEYLCRCGVSYITTMHGDKIEDVYFSKMNKLIKANYLDNVIILGDTKGKIKQIYSDLTCKEEILC